MDKSVKRITLAGTRLFNYNISIAKAFTDLGVEVENINYKRLPTFIENSSVFKWFITLYNYNAHKHYIRSIQSSLLKSDLLVLFGRSKLLNEDDISSFKRLYKIPVIIWLIDSIYSTPNWHNLFKNSDLIVCYNKSEVDTLIHHSIKSIFMPLAFDPTYYFQKEASIKEIDVYFIGSLSPRIQFLDELAQKLIKLKISILIDGKINFFKRLEFLLSGKYKYFRKCASYKSRSHEQINNLTNKSKICLNIQPKQATSALNIRTYEILGAGGFQITNSTPILELLFKNEQHLVIYNDLDDLINKIRYYLGHTREREQIAINGCMHANKAHSFNIRVEELLKSI